MDNKNKLNEKWKNRLKFQQNELDIQMQVKSPDPGLSLVYRG